jgi:GDP-L-fucose synthase
MIRRFHQAVAEGSAQVRCWGSGRPRREFLYADDVAEACHVLLDSYDDDRPINVGTGTDTSIAELANHVAAAVGFAGEIY